MKKEMKLIFSDGKIYLALLVMLLCFNGYSIPIWIEIWDWDFAYRESALQLTIGGIFFGGIMLLVLKNGCKDYISRKYLPAFKKYLGI